MKTPIISDVQDPRNLLQIFRDIEQKLTRNDEMIQAERERADAQFERLHRSIRPTLIDGVGQPAEALTKLGVDQIATKKSNLSALTDPGVGDDQDSGYGSGSFWLRVDGTPKGFVCIGANPGAADWRQIF